MKAIILIFYVLSYKSREAEVIVTLYLRTLPHELIVGLMHNIKINSTAHKIIDNFTVHVIT